MEIRKMKDGDCKSVFTLNTWTDEKKDEARKYLEEGYWVHFGSSAIGHTMAAMVEADGLAWAQEEYAGILRVAQREGSRYIYCQII